MLSWAGVVVLTALTVAGAFDATGVLPLGGGLDVVVALAALALVPFLWTRRQLPVAYALAALAVLGPTATPASTVAVLAIARSRSVRTALPVAVVGFAAHAVQGLWRPIPLPYGWWLLCAAAVFAALLGWGAYWKARAELLLSLRERARRAERDQAERVERARHDERTRIAREMHDTLAHRLTLIAATAGALEYRPDAPPEQAAAAAARVRDAVSGALDDLRGILRLLRAGPDELRPAPGLADLGQLVAEARAAGGAVRYDDGGTLDGVEAPPALALAAYRVVQEGLTNARRHAPDAAVSVTIAREPDGMRVAVVDDGATAPAAGASDGSGTGLVGLAERVELLGGTLDVGPRPDGPGFAVVAWLPWGGWERASGSRSSTTTPSSEQRCD
ncbi:histidine kinase [Beutenbergia cavernae DSM 12333]|uniref:histidine kinase n=1 Tax=Beutenbergia cavernae (strain ATCC BAA-8 / DSM 12333 / CCUG 43141 / JCM 11478 / NBRC 16432 / NCIMB 13614 / HKI 0122) TaxID=471853 RepID=C5BWA2_BEUC1|nr:histidine kinase [Beutenbergia cavernae DSM 12333]